jgi:ribonucleotide monophosphatase NagD (HAD superfamily)
MIGDSIADIEGGNKLGMETMLVLTGCGNQTKKTISDEIQPTFVVSSLQEGASVLLRECR